MCVVWCGYVSATAGEGKEMSEGGLGFGCFDGVFCGVCG